MSKQTREFFEQVKSGQSPTLVESIRSAAASLKEVGGKIWDALTPTFEHGAHEAASLLFRGDAFVMYPKNNHDKVSEHDLPQETQQQEQDRGGREM